MKQKCEICGKEYKAYGCYRGNDIHIYVMLAGQNEISSLKN